MPISSIQSFTDLYGEQYTFWVDGLLVYFRTNLRPDPIIAFAQLVEDSPITVTIERDGKITVTYLDASGDRLTQSSQRDGDAGTWS